jgi:phi13 family phage major tail protein
MGNKITYGLEQVHIAFKASDNTWDMPKAIPGAVRWTPTPKGEPTNFKADNTDYFIYESNDGYTGELEMANIPDAVIAEMLGWIIDDNGMLVEVANATPKKFALMGQVQGDAKNRRFVYYDCQASRPAKEHRTREGAITPATDVLALNILPIDATVSGEVKKVVKGTIELSDTNAATYNAFFDAVTLPSAAVDKTALDAAIALAGTLTEETYTAATWGVLESSLTKATTVSADADAVQAEVDAATIALNAAIVGLEVDEG